MTVAANFLREEMRSFGKTTYKKFLLRELIHDWSNLVDESIAGKVRPVALEHGVLFVAVQSAAFQDQLKFFAEEIIDAINDVYRQAEPLVKELRIARGFQIADNPPPEMPPPAQVAPSATVDEVPLTDEEVARCEAKAARFSDEKLRQTVLQTLLTQARSQKFRLASGWHKCKTCDTLCPPEEIFCEACAVREREAMRNELFKILYDEPWLTTRDVLKIFSERMPHMRRECSPDVVESARTSLIQKIAGRVRFGDEESPDVMKLVMLEKRLPPEKITPAIVRRTLIDLQFNLSDQAKLQRYTFKTRNK